MNSTATKTAPASIASADFNARLFKDRSFAAHYLETALAEGDLSLFLMAVRNVADAHGGVAQVAKKAGVGRTHAYQILSPQGNPSLPKLDAILKAMGFTLRVGILPQEVA